MTIQEMQEKKREMGITYAEIARRAGLPLPTVQKVLSGTTRSPRYETIIALEKVLFPAPGGQNASDAPVSSPAEGRSGDHNLAQAPSPRSAGEAYASCDGMTSGYFPYRNIIASDTQPVYGENHDSYNLRKSADHGRYRTGESTGNSHPLLPRKQQGEYTAADREHLPGDVRTELIDGVLYDMDSPKAAHQITLVNLSNQLFNQIEKCGGEGMVFVAPSDVWLTGDDKNIFQPDIYILSDYTMIGRDGYTKGTPPFITEILSPSTRSKDLLLKSYKYHAAGVREYWIVDPENRQVTVYDYDRDPDGTVNTRHTFDETVSVGISGGSWSVDFSIIKAALEKVGM